MDLKFKDILDGREITKARNRWFASDDGRECLEPYHGGLLSAKYLRNRIERAFLAGVRAATRILQPQTTGMFENQNLARLKCMRDQPGLYSHGVEDVIAINWAIRLIESIEAERERMRLERTRLHQYRAGMQEEIRKLAEIDRTWDQKPEI